MMLVLLLACAPDYSEGQVQRGSLNCQWMDTCGQLALLNYDTVDACIAAAEAQEYDDKQCPNYSSKAMNTCLDAYEKAIEAKDCEADFNEVCTVCG